MDSLESIFIIDVLRGLSAPIECAERLERDSIPRVVVPLGAAEVLLGSTFYGKKAITESHCLLSSPSLLEFGKEARVMAGKMGARLLVSGERLGAIDLYIAAITLRHGETLRTRDREFSRVQGLTVETY